MNVMLGKLFDESLWAHLFPGLMIYSISSARSSFWRVSKTDSDRQRDWYSLTAAATKPEEPVERAIERASGDDCVCVCSTKLPRGQTKQVAIMWPER